MATQGMSQPMSRWLTLLAHAVPFVIVASILVRLVVYVNHDWAVLAWTDTAMTLATVIVVFSLYAHLLRGELCLKCVQDSPLDPERAVRREKVFLWQAHLPRMVFLVGWVTFTAISVGGTALGWGWWSKVPLDVGFYVIMWGAWSHHRLQPWCPWCRGWDEGGDEELVPDPDPSEKATR